MSSRLRERGGGGGKIMASKPSRTVAEATPKVKEVSKRSTPISGKENSRSLSRGRRNPVAELPAAAASVTGGVRWSTSALPRGKPSGGSEFNRIFSGLRGERRSFEKFTSMERCQQGSGKFSDSKGFKASEDRNASGCHAKSGSRVLDVNLRESIGKSGDTAMSFKESRQKDGLSSGRKLPDAKAFNQVGETNVNGYIPIEIGKNKASLGSKAKPLGGKALGGMKISSEKKPLVFTVRVLDEPMDANYVLTNEEKSINASEKYSKDVIKVMDNCEGGIAVSKVDHKVETREKSSHSIQGSENVNEKKVDDEGKAGKETVSKYPSKIHEKLAFLEEKVQRIASDIRHTKEMLDLNNPDESKLILRDIQSKISGLEKAVGHVMGTKGELCSSDTGKDGGLQAKNIAMSQSAKEGELKSSVNGLNHEELEARFFPHHKLLRSRASSSSSVELQKGSGSGLSKHNGASIREDGSLSPIDENPIALEFLASLDTSQSNICNNSKALQSELNAVSEAAQESSASSVAHEKAICGRRNEDIILETDEKLDEYDDQENKPAIILHDDIEESSMDQLYDIGSKTSTGGWFVSEGEAVLLAHDDGSCSYHDIANSEEKSVYRPPAGVSNNLWGDCWLIRAPGPDGSSGRYVVAASAGNALDSGFCSWDFYTKDIQAFQVDDGSSFSTSSSRMVLAPLSNTVLTRRSTLSSMPTCESRQWWYKPCGPLLISTASRQKTVNAHDIRDGDLVMQWEASSPVIGMECSSPLQWRSRGKLIIAATEGISLWDVNSPNPQPLLSVASAGKKVYSLHVNNTDAELGGGVRQRVSSSEVEGNDGVFCTQESINVFDFRLPTGVGLRISRVGATGHSIFSRGDSIFVGSTESKLSLRSRPNSSIQHFSLRKGKLMTTFALPDSNAHIHHSTITQVWGNSKLVMGINGLGLHVFDATKDEAAQPSGIERGNTVQVKLTVGSDDLYHPTFDYLGSRVLIISRDRPAIWRYLL